MIEKDPPGRRGRGRGTIVVAAVIQGQVGLETSNNIIEKGLALRPRQSGSVVASTGY